MAQPLTPWVALEDVLRVYAPELIDPATGEPIDDPAVAMWQAAIDSATWMMWALSGGKVHPQESYVEDYALIGSCEVIPLNGPLKVVLAAQSLNSCSHNAAPPLPTHPIVVPSESLEFCQDFQRINFCCGGAVHFRMRALCGCGEPWVRIFYLTDSTLPPGTEGRVAWFADQYMKAATGDKGCQLPDRIQSVTRQGVSWTMLDPMDFLDKKLTGVGRLDSWLTTVRLVYPASQLIDPLRSQRRNSLRVVEGLGDDMGYKNEVWIGLDQPPDSGVELWFDPDAQPGDPVPVAADAEKEKVS